MHDSIAAWLVAALCAAPGMAQEAKPAAPAEGQKTEQKKTEPTILKIGDKVAEDVKLSTLDGKDFTFKEVRGKTVVIHFWSTTCPWEKVAEPKLMKLAADYKDKGVVLLAVNANQNEILARPDAAAFGKDAKNKPYAALRSKADEVGMNHEVLVDHGGDVGRLFAAKSTPHCFVIDAQGTLAYSGALDEDGAKKDVPESGQYVRKAVDAVRAGKKVETPTTKPYG